VVLDFLPRDELLTLRDPLRKALGEGWRVEVVGDPDRTPECISADRAVDLREDLTQRLFFLVIVDEAGAGLQGVYDVAEVVPEGSALRQVRTALRRELRKHDRGLENYAWQACLAARTRVGSTQRTDVFFRREVEYLDAVAASPSLENAGRLLHRVGLIPDGAPKPETLSSNAEVLRELLRTERNRPSTAADRVGRLGLTDDSLRRALIDYLRDKPLHATDEWLPGLLDEGLTFEKWTRVHEGAEITGVELLPWRQANGSPYRWSGLQVDRDDGSLFFSVHPDSQVEYLEVRWKSIPPKLPAKSVEYQLSLEPVGGGAPLLVEFHEHRATASGRQAFRFSKETVRENLQEGTVFIRIAVVGRGEGDDNPIEPLLTEEFRVTKSTMPEPHRTDRSAAKLTRSAWDFRLERALAGAFDEPESCRAGQDDLHLVLGAQHRRIVLPGKLRALESLLLSDADETPVYRAHLAADGSLPDTFEAQNDPAWQEDAWQEFRRARTRIFKKLRKKAKDLSGQLIQRSRGKPVLFRRSWKRWT